MDDKAMVEFLMWVYIIIGGSASVIGAFCAKVQDNSPGRKLLLCFLYGINLVSFTFGVTFGIALLKTLYQLAFLLWIPMFLILLAFAFYLPAFLNSVLGESPKPDVIRIQCYLAGIILLIGGC
jgi:hypothetical protein